MSTQDSLMRRAAEAISLSARRPGTPVPTPDYQRKQAETAARLVQRAAKAQPSLRLAGQPTPNGTEIRAAIPRRSR